MRRLVFAPAVRWTVWLISLAIYTYLLVVPNDWLPPWLRVTVGTKITDEFSFGKLAHAGAYGVLTAATYWLPVGRTGWWACIVVLSAHGFGTEYVQTFTGRTGCWRDVLIDHVGIVSGLLLGGLGHWLLCGRPRGDRLDGISASPEMQQQAGGKDRHADPL
jgi:hypothetical protein